MGYTVKDHCEKLLEIFMQAYKQVPYRVPRIINIPQYVHFIILTDSDYKRAFKSANNFIQFANTVDDMKIKGACNILIRKGVPIYDNMNKYKEFNYDS